MAAQAIAFHRMRLGDGKCSRNSKVPLFGGDFNDHLLLHHSGMELHLMHHNSTPADRRLAVACMRHLLTDRVAKLPSGKEVSAEVKGAAEHAVASLKILQVCPAAHTALQRMVWRIRTKAARMMRWKAAKMMRCQMPLAATRIRTRSGALHEKLIGKLVGLWPSATPDQHQPSTQGGVWISCWVLRWMLYTVQHSTGCCVLVRDTDHWACPKHLTTLCMCRLVSKSDLGPLLPLART